METLFDIERYLINIAINRTAPLPDCILGEDFICTGCVIDEPRMCLLYNNWEIRSYLKFHLANLSHSMIGIDAKKEEIIVNAIVTVMKEHGPELPLHLDKISRMTLDRNPAITVNRNQIGIILAKNNHVFEKVDLAVYKLKAWNNPKETH